MLKQVKFFLFLSLVGFCIIYYLICIYLLLNFAFNDIPEIVKYIFKFCLILKVLKLIFTKRYFRKIFYFKDRISNEFRIFLIDLFLYENGKQLKKNNPLLNRLILYFDHVFLISNKTQNKYAICEILISKSYKRVAKIYKGLILFPRVLVYTIILLEIYIIGEIYYSLLILPLWLISKIWIIEEIIKSYFNFKLNTEAFTYFMVQYGDLKIIPKYAEICPDPIKNVDGLFYEGLNFIRFSTIQGFHKDLNKRKARKLRNYYRYCNCYYQTCDYLGLEVLGYLKKWDYFTRGFQILIILGILFFY